MRKLTAAAVLVFCFLFLLPGSAHAQQLDVFFGANTVTAPSASATSSSDHFPQSLTGGFYPTLGGDFLFFHHFGVGMDVAWRGSKSDYAADASYPFRPIFYDFNVVYAPPITHKVQPEFQAGIGAEDIRFYQSTYVCNYYTGVCRNYVSSKHFLAQFGAGVKFYVHGNFFVRPEVHIYLVNNNLEFSSARATRFGVAIGYTFGSH